MDMGQGDMVAHSNLMSNVRHFHLLSAQITWFMMFFSLKEPGVYAVVQFYPRFKFYFQS